MRQVGGARTQRIGTRRYKRVFLVVTEGRQTEVQYFDYIKRRLREAQVTVVHSGGKSSPRGVLKCAKSKAKQMRKRKGDEVWLVIDRDTWESDDIDEVFNECKTRGYHLAVSNPQFEYWLLLHFVDCSVSSKTDCLTKLSKQLPDYDKSNIVMSKLAPNIPTAINNAKKRDDPPTPDWPKDPGCTTVYRLVEKLLPPPQPGS